MKILIRVLFVLLVLSLFVATRPAKADEDTTYQRNNNQVCYTTCQDGQCTEWCY